MRSARGTLSPGRASHHEPAAPPLYAPAGSRDGQIVRLRTLRLNEFLRSFWIPPSSIERLLGSGGTRTRHHRFASTKRRLVVSIIRSRMSRLPMPPVLGTQERLITQPSRVNAMRT